MKQDLTKLLESYPGHNSPDMSTKDLLDWAVEVDSHIPELLEIVKGRNTLSTVWDKTLEWDKEASIVIKNFEKNKQKDSTSILSFGDLCEANEKQKLAFALRSLLWENGYSSLPNPLGE